MSFEPLGGFPSIVRKEDSINQADDLKTRGFSTTNIVNISNIMEKKKKDIFLSLSSEDESGVSENLFFEEMMFTKPNDYEKISYIEFSDEFTQKKKSNKSKK